MHTCTQTCTTRRYFIAKDLLESLKYQQGVFPDLPDILHSVGPLGVHLTPPTWSTLEVVVFKLLPCTRIDDIITKDVKDPARKTIGGAGVSHVRTISTYRSSYRANPGMWTSIKFDIFSNFCYNGISFYLGPEKAP